jgi:hypothetical protein
VRHPEPKSQPQVANKLFLVRHPVLWATYEAATYCEAALTWENASSCEAATSCEADSSCGAALSCEAASSCVAA